MRKWSILLLLLLLVSSTIGIGYRGWHRTSQGATQREDINQHAHLPDFVQDAGTDAAVAYQYATDYPEILEQIPCHCGCEKALAHKDNLACYITGFNPDGSVTQYDPHAAYCGVCLDITRQVMKLVSEGKAVPEIHRVIDTQYSYSGPHPHVIGSVQ